jgi:cytochrome P450
MDGTEHRRYRALVQPSFLPKRASWWTERWVVGAIDALLDRMAPNGAADLNVEFFSAIPLLTITGSFGVSVGDALDIREAVTSDGLGIEAFTRIVPPIVRARREEPRDDLISVLVAAEITEEDGSTHRLTDEEVLIFAFILLAAGSGTTWKQMGITMLALFQHPEWLAAVRDDRAQLRPVVEETLRWMPTDPMFSRFVAHDTELGGVAVAEGSVMHVCLAAANRDPARWERPDEFDPSRPVQPHMGFGDGAHICLGMHVARAEIVTAIGALLDRFPDLRLDTDAPAPHITGMYERGPTSVPVRF